MDQSILGMHHDHIDGSRAVLDVLGELHMLSDGTGRFTSAREIRAYFENPHENIVAKFGTVTSLLQTREALLLLGRAYGHRRWNEGYLYVEAKFAPQYHRAKGLTLRQATAAMCDGLWDAQKKYGIRILPQLCIGREADPGLGVEIAKIALEYDGAVALDLACDEAGHPPEKHLPAYRLTHGSKVKRDCHAGEWVGKEPAATYRARLLENVRTAVRTLQCDGIGHAIPLHEDVELVKEIADKGIRVSACPLSNVVCGGIKDVRELHLDRLLDAGVILTLNPDDDLFLPPMNEVVDACQDAYAFTRAQRKKLSDNVWRGAFAEDVRHNI